MSWKPKINLSSTNHSDWVVWGKGGAMYEMNQKSSRSPVEEMAEGVRQSFLTSRKLNSSLSKKK